MRYKVILTCDGLQSKKVRVFDLFLQSSVVSGAKLPFFRLLLLFESAHTS